MPNLTSVGIVNGIPNSGTGTVSTIDSLLASSTTGTQSIVAGSTSSVTVLASNTSRNGATFYNDSTAICYLLIGTGTASSTVFSVYLGPSMLYELPLFKGGTYTGIVSGIWASATGNMRVTEYT